MCENVSSFVWDPLCSMVGVCERVVALQAEIEVTLNRVSISNAKVFFILLELMFNLSKFGV